MIKKIIIIEDDKFLRELIARKLVQEGYKALESVDGEDGLKKIKDEKPDLILLDLLLPNIDGFEVLERVKADQSLGSIPVIIISNLGQKEDIERALKLGAVDYMVKAQFTPAEIIKRVKEALS